MKSSVLAVPAQSRKTSFISNNKQMQRIPQHVAALHPPGNSEHHAVFSNVAFGPSPLQSIGTLYSLSPTPVVSAHVLGGSKIFANITGAITGVMLVLIRRHGHIKRAFNYHQSPKANL